MNKYNKIKAITDLPNWLKWSKAQGKYIIINKKRNE